MLTPEQEAAGWRVQAAGGMWIKTCNINEMKPVRVAPAWVERLACQWEREASEDHPLTAAEREFLRNCAAEMRAKARGEP